MADPVDVEAPLQDRFDLLAELVERTADLAHHEEQAAAAKARRDDVIRRLRALEDPPSARSIAGLAGISDVQVLNIAKADG